MKLDININKFRRTRIDNREFTSSMVPISDTMEIKMKVRDKIRDIKYNFKHIFRRK